MPYNFSWLVPSKLAGMARPRRSDAEWLRFHGVTAVLSLTEKAAPELEGIEALHEAVPDMCAPTLDQLHRGVQYIDAIVDGGGAVAVHCAAGMGRTGTFLAAYLVARGQGAKSAVRAVREKRPGSIETVEQEVIIERFAELIGVDPS